MLEKANSIIKIAIVASIIFAIFGMFIISENTHHMDICEDDDCSICAIIQMAQTIINMIKGFFLLYFIGFIMYFLLSKIKNNVINIENKSLVFQKVQLNV